MQNVCRIHFSHFSYGKATANKHLTCKFGFIVFGLFAVGECFFVCIVCFCLGWVFFSGFCFSFLWMILY